MIKIIAAFDGLKFSDSTLSYAIHIAKFTNAHLVGVFLEDQNSFSQNQIKSSMSSITEKRLHKSYENDLLLLKKSINKFEISCKSEKLNYSIHHDHHTAILDLQKESIYADLLIINRNETLTNYTEKIPTRFIKYLLSDIHCPVLLTPTNFTPIINTVLLYNGEPASVLSIKHFSYILPEFSKLQTELISVNSFSENLHLHDGVLMKEFLKRHFTSATYSVLKGFPEIELLKKLLKKSDDTVIIMGSLKRGMLSRLLWSSLVDILLKELSLPIFISYTD